MAIFLPPYVATGQAYQPITASTAATIPLWQTRGAAGTAAVGAPVTISMHSEKQALTTYSNFGFNSYAIFNGVPIAASTAGIFSLTGASDNGAAITGTSRTGVTDMGSMHLKRADRIYLRYRSSGQLNFRLITDGTQIRDYLTIATDPVGIHTGRVQVGKGVNAGNWQVEISNLAGASFYIDSVELLATVLKRRLRGGNA